MVKGKQILDIDFREIRTLEGRQNVAFEEFCCHIARHTKDVPSGSEYIRYRGAGGDGGVECVWILPNGEEWGWQAKYLFKLNKKQLEKSIKTAFEIHPNLTQYTICLPLDSTGPTGSTGKSNAEKFDEYKKEWQSLAENQGMKVQFKRLCKSELLDELLEFDPHGGRLKFWFDKDHFGNKWFENHLNDTTRAAEPRYTPKLSVEVPVSMAFEEFGRTHRWEKSVHSWVKNIEESRKSWLDICGNPNLGPDAPDFPEPAREYAQSLASLLSRIKQDLIDLPTHVLQINIISKLNSLVAEAFAHATRFLSIAVEELENKYGNGVANSVSFRQFMTEYQVSFPAHYVDTSRDVITTLKQLRNWLNRSEAQLPMSSAMLLLGPGGIGKTHAICDIALDRHERGLRSVALLGERFNHISGEPWERIRSMLGLSSDISLNELFGLLDAAGECTDYPCIVFIDALDETKPRKFWYDSLSSLIEQVRRYDWLKLCVSCRSTYYEDVVAQNVKIPEVEHTGFEGVEFDACFEFFHFYGLESPSMPLMQPEFSNPLFLRLVCESLKDAGVKRLPEGMVGISEVIRSLLDSKNEKLSKVLDYNTRERPVQKALDFLISEMQEGKTTWLPWSKAKELVDSIWPSPQRSSSLFDNLIREGLIREDRVVDASGTGTQDAIFISFERLADYLLAEKYLAEISKESLHAAFAPGGILNFTVFDECAMRENRGLLEALSIHIPEKYSLELSEVAVNSSPNSVLTLAIIESLIWRADGSLGQKAREIVSSAFGNDKTFTPTMEALFALSTRTGNPLNALWFHKFFSSIPMPDRDKAWCPYLHNTYNKLRGLDRLLRWALKADLGAVSDDTAELWTSQLCWFCAASDRRVRDYATKAMVRIMEGHETKWPQVIKRFSRIDDEYVIERCLAAAYGSLIRANRKDAIKETASTVYEVYFKNNLLPQNAMVRDYARLILEFAAYRNLLTDDIKLEHFRPPYESEWPLDWPEEDFIEQYKDSYWALPKLYESCMDNDFAHYTVTRALGGLPYQKMDREFRWIFKHVLDMGYTSDRFAQFDGFILTKYGPGRAKPIWVERIGKKYQWIAIYRLMARVHDHFPRKFFNGDQSLTSIPELQSLELRNIDPTLLIKSEQRTDTPAWWAPIKYDFKKIESNSDDEWLNANDFPNFASMLKVQNPSDGRAWLVLQAQLDWRSKDYGAENRYPYRYIKTRLHSYVLRRADQQRCWNWLIRQNLWTKCIPAGHNLYEGFLGEYPWGLPFTDIFDQIKSEGENSDAPCEMLPTVHTVICDYEYDAYQEDKINIFVPSEIFFTPNKLHWDGTSGYRSDSGKLSFTYPSVFDAGPPALLVDLEYLIDFLETNELVIVWTILANKDCIYKSTSNFTGYTEHSRAHMFIDGKIKSSKGITNHVKSHTNTSTSKTKK